MSTLSQLLPLNSIQRTRRNHALEHATLRVLAGRNRGLMLAGYSDPNGFWIAGKVDSNELISAVEEAARRLRAGEHELAIHPNCGTNFATTGVLAGLVAWLAMLNVGKGWQRKLDRLPLVMAGVTLALIVSQPLGPRIQRRFTTDAQLGSLRVTTITLSERNGLPLHRVHTAD